MSYPGTDAALVAAATRGDNDALDALVEECLDPVLEWCARLGGYSVDPEDAAHDVMVVVVTRLASLRDPVAFPYWLFGITRKVLAKHRRRSLLRRWVPWEVPDTADPEPDPLRSFEMGETSRLVAAVLNRLPTSQREALVLCDLEGRSATEASLLLGVPQGTVKSRLRLGRARFRAFADELNLHPDGGRVPDLGLS